MVLIGDAATRTVRAYESGGRRVRGGIGARRRSSPMVRTGRSEEDALIGPDGARLARLPGHIAYWFAWQGFVADAPLAEPDGNSSRD